ncbi:hypothetical protein WDZ17_00045 [Pseudokineococcus basanitobsidens]|uniref:ADP-ribosylglycohydrolase n=1 Tax=Pseudokineococcus basanitobsidens TaxID=1926649 RepID=A0ABU8RF85_9ACTN
MEGVKDLDRLRGMLAGLVLGDALGVAEGDVPGTLRIGVAGQLACFTVDGLIRAHCREVDTGIDTHRPTLVWLSSRRWARLQGLPVADAENGVHSERQTDDWLAGVPAFVERRGSAPATAAAVASSRSAEDAVRRESHGAHGLVRGLPFAVAGVALRAVHWANQARDVARLTHSPVVGDLTLLATRWLACAWASGDPWRGAQLVMATGADAEHLVRDTALRAYGTSADADVLANLAPDRSARSALLGGVYAALSCGGRSSVEEALTNAAAVPKAGPGVAAVAGAALGAAYGVEALPSSLLGRLEVAREVDRLARDLAAAVDLGPHGRDLYGTYPTI